MKKWEHECKELDDYHEKLRNDFKGEIHEDYIELLLTQFNIRLSYIKYTGMRVITHPDKKEKVYIPLRKIINEF